MFAAVKFRRSSTQISKEDRRNIRLLEELDKKYLKLQPYFDIINEHF